MPTILTTSGVLMPTQTASIQCVLGSSRVLRLNLVSPPEPHSIGKPKTCNCLNNSQRVVFTAAASRNGAFDWERSFFRRSGFFLRKSRISFVPLAMLHFPHARQRLLIRFDPSLARDTICSICRGTSFLPQYAHALFHFSKRYSLISYPCNVPCWYSIPDISGFSSSCISNLTRSMLIAVMLQTFLRRVTHVRVFTILLMMDGASHPSFLLRRFLHRASR